MKKETASDQHGIVVRLDVPVDHHPDAIRGDGPGARVGRDGLRALYECYGKINDTAAQVGDKARLAHHARPVAERAVDAAGSAIRRMTEQAGALDRKIEAALNTVVEPAIAAQVRSHWATVGDAEALSGIRRAIQNGDQTTATAVLNAPAYLSGLTAENQALLRTVAAEAFAPDEVRERAETVAAIQKLERANEHFMETVAARLREWSDHDQRVIEEGLR